MNQQVFVIHGGNAFDSYEEYLVSLKEKVVSLEDLKRNDWKALLQKDLGNGFNVYNPRMPNAQNARYEEWKIYFEKFLPLLNDDVIFVGHSLGGIFLAKYFSENKVTKKVQAIFIVAAPCNTKENHPLRDFTVPSSLSLITNQSKKVIFYHSKDDVVVSFTNLEDFKKFLPEAEFKIFEDRGHFNQEVFSEIVEDIKKVVVST